MNEIDTRAISEGIKAAIVEVYYSIEDFCELHGIDQETFDRFLKAGEEHCNE